MCTEYLRNRVLLGEWMGLGTLTSFGSLMHLLNKRETPFSRRTVWIWIEKKKCLRMEKNLSYLFFKSKAFTKLFWKNQFADCLEGPGSGGRWQHYCKVEFVPSDLGKQLLNIFENCAESLVRNFDLWLYDSTAGKQSPSSICRREHPPVGHLELLELLDSSLMSS